MITLLFEATPYNLTTSANVTVNLTGANSDYRTVDFNALKWTPCITGAPKCSVTVWEEGMVQDTTTQWTELEFRLSSELGNTAWQNYRWGGQNGRLWYGKVGDTFANFTKVFEGTISEIRVEDGLARISLLGPEATLNNPLCDTYYTGSGGSTGSINGGTDLQGHSKPVCYGSVQNIEPVQISSQFEVYQVHSGQVNGITAVYENAMTLGTSAGNYADYAGLTGATLAQGTWATCHNLGLFRLASKPNGLITCDVNGAVDATAGYVTTLGTILPAMMRAKGILDANIDQTSAGFGAFTNTWNYFCQEDNIMVGDIVRSALSSVGGYLLTTSTGGFTAGKYLASSTATPLLSDRSAAPLVNKVTREMPAAPAYRLKLGSNRSWRVHTKDEVSSALYSSAADAAAALAAATAAQNTANQAAADAAAANAEIATIANDNRLDRSEKAIIIREVGRIQDEKNNIDTTGSALGLTSLTSAYDTQYNSLMSYLATLTSPVLWSNLTDYTTIVGTTFRTNFNNYYGARSAVLNAAAQLAAIAAYLTKDTISLPASSAGVVSSFSNANGRFVVVQGNTDISESCTFSVTSTTGFDSTSDYTLSNGTGSKGTYSIVGDWPGTGIATLNLRATYGSATFDKTVTVVKSLAGATGSTGSAGADGTYSWTPVMGGGMTRSGTTFTNATGYSAGTYSAYFFGGEAAAGMSISGKLGQTTGQWVMGLDTDAAAQTSSNTTYDYWLGFSTGGVVSSGHSNVTDNASLGSYTTGDIFAVAHKGTSIVAYKNGSILYTWSGVSTSTAYQAYARTSTVGSMTSVAVAVSGSIGLPGQDAVTGYLSNESHNVQTDSAGNGGDYSSAGGTFHVFAGSTDVTVNAATSYSLLSNTSGLSISINSTSWRLYDYWPDG
jgi:hypothetical protein